MLRMVSYPHRPKSGHITCYLNRTYHVLTTAKAPALAKFSESWYSRRPRHWRDIARNGYPAQPMPPPGSAAGPLEELMRFSLRCLFAISLLSGTSSLLAQSWQNVTAQLPRAVSPTAPILLSDGSVLVHNACGRDWYK